MIKKQIKSIRLIINFDLLLLFEKLTPFMSSFLISLLVPIDDDPLTLIISELFLAFNELLSLPDFLAVSSKFLLLKHLLPKLDTVSSTPSLFVKDSQLFLATVFELSKTPHVS